MNKIINGCRNFRDLSLKVEKLKKGLIYRSDSFYGLDDKDIEIFKQLKITDVIDFRSEEERNAHPNVKIDHVNYHEIVALHTKDGLENFYFFMLINETSTPQDIINASQFVRDGYLELPFNNLAYKKVFQLMLESENPFVYHCSSGKDRTGLMSALILKLLGMSDQEIFDDYLLSNDILLEGSIAHANELGFQGKTKEMIIYCCSVHKELLESSFKEILNKYKSFEEYFLMEYDLDVNKIKYLRSKYLIK